MSRRAIAAGLLALLAASPQVAAIFMRLDTVQVPIDRLVVNLENELLAKPKDVQTLINLARLHAMAYSLKTDTFPAAGLPERPAYPPGSPELPRNVQPAKTPEETAAAAGHLKESIRRYEEALELAPDNLTARLGHGWTLEQSGNKSGAIADYRAVVKQAWQEDQKLRGLGPTQRVFTSEAAGYLIPLLDKQRDAEEIADLQAKQAKIRALPRAITPVAVPLADDLAPDALVDDRARVRFDADGTGAREWTWITPDAGWLVYDAIGRGEITSALQLFGNVTFWLFWSNGYEPMRALDDNHDGTLSGPELGQLAIWRDADRDGIADRGEVLPLASHGIVALSCDHVEVDDARFAAVSQAGVRLANGATRPTYDVLLKTARTKP
jgi:tetratricopeptide (TPR) repeat protein